MSNIVSVVMLIVVSALFYFLVAVIKNIVSRLNLKYTLKIKYGNYSNHVECNKKKSEVYCSYIERKVHRGPNVVHLNICTFTYRTSAKMLVVREGWFDKLFKLIGVSSEFQTGFSWFDQRYYIVTESDGAIKKILSNEETLNSIDALLREGFDYLKYHDGVLKVGYSTFSGWRWFTSGVVERCTNEIAKLRELVESGLSPNRKVRSRPFVCCDKADGYFGLYINLPDKDLRRHPKKWVRQRAIWLSSGAYVAALGVLAMIIHIWFSPYPVIDPELVVSGSLLYLAIPMMVVHLLAAGMHLKGRSRSHKELYWITLLSSFGYSFIAALMLQIMNGVFDASPLEAQPTILVDTGYSPSAKGPDTYSIVVKSWRQENTERLDVSKAFHSVARNRHNQAITIFTKRGAFNIERLIDYRFND